MKALKYANSNSNTSRPQSRDDSFRGSENQSIRIVVNKNDPSDDAKSQFSKEVEEWDAFEVDFKAKHGFNFPW